MSQQGCHRTKERTASGLLCQPPSLVMASRSSVSPSCLVCCQPAAQREARVWGSLGILVSRQYAISSSSDLLLLWSISSPRDCVTCTVAQAGRLLPDYIVVVTRWSLRNQSDHEEKAAELEKDGNTLLAVSRKESMTTTRIRAASSQRQMASAV